MWLIKSGSWHNKAESMSDSILYSMLFFSHYNSLEQFEVEFFKLVVFGNIFNTIVKGV